MTQDVGVNDRIVEGLLQQRAGALRDADGRPLAEVSAPSYGEVVTEVVACPYRDRRAGKPMNVTALRQLTACWPSLLGTVRTLAGPTPTVHRAWRAAIACITAPLLGPEPVPVPLAALYKTALGLTQATTALLLADDGVADVPLASLGGPGAFFAWLDEGEWLLGQQQVCSGPQPMIERMYGALCGRGEEAPAEAFVALGDPASWADTATAVVGLQAAYLAAAYQAVRRGDDAGIEETPAATWLRASPPWLRAVLAVPNRPPEHARRLFPAGAAPEVLEAFLAAGPGSARALAERFDLATRPPG
jgi:hypothetical protein